MFNVAQSYTIIARIVLIAACAAGLVYTGWHMRGTHDVAATAKATDKAIATSNMQAEQDNKIAVANDQKRVQIEYRDRIITQRVTVAAAAPDYATCRLNDADLNLLNRAITGDVP